MSRKWDSEKQSRVPGRPARGGLYHIFITNLCTQIWCNLPGGRFYQHKLFAWPGFGFYLHKRSTVARRGDLDKNCDFQRSKCFWFDEFDEKMNTIFKNAPRCARRFSLFLSFISFISVSLFSFFLFFSEKRTPIFLGNYWKNEWERSHRKWRFSKTKIKFGLINSKKESYIDLYALRALF